MYNEIGNILYYSIEASFTVKFFLNEYRSWTWPREIGRKLILPNLREDENMGETCRGSAIPLTEQRTDQMIVMISIGIVFALAVGGFIMAANIYGGQDHSPPDDAQQIVKDYFDPAETAQSQSLREPSFVWESERGEWGPLCTEKGSIDIVGYYLPYDCLPLCIDDDYLSQWYVDILVYGGYHPWDGFIDVWQKRENQGRILIDWEYVGKGDCCAYDYWRAHFYTEARICLDSNQYPDVAPWIIDVPDGQNIIPGKEVFFCISTFWTGCVPGNDQDFTIIPTQSYWSFSESSSSLCKSKTVTPIKTSHSLSSTISEQHRSALDPELYAVLQPKQNLRLGDLELKVPRSLVRGPCPRV